MKKCPICGQEFEPLKKEGLICSSCPMSSGCATATCPRCGYVLPPESKIVNMIKRITGSGKSE